MTNRKQLESAGILKKGAKLSADQKKAIDSLTAAEIKLLISIKKKLMDKFPVENIAAPITHHH